MSSRIETGSLTWRAVEDFCQQVRREAIADLIADRHPERARGAIQTADRLLALAEPVRAPAVTSDSYD